MVLVGEDNNCPALQPVEALFSELPQADLEISTGQGSAQTSKYV